MKTTYKILIGAVIILLAIFTFSSMNKSKANNVSEINIGAVLSLTGYGSSDSENIKRGMDLAKDELLKKGININIDYQDDKTDPKETVTAIRYAAMKKPDAIFGPIWSYLADAGSQSIKDSKIATYSPSLTSEELTTDTDNFLHGAIKMSKATDGITKILKDGNIKTVAVITTNGTWGDNLLSVFKKASTNAGAEVVLSERVNFGDEPSMLPMFITKIKANKNIQAVLWTGSEEGATILIKKMNELGINVPIIGTNALPIVIKKGNVPKGNLKIYFTDSKKSAEFTDKFKAKYGVENGSYSEEAYDGVMMIAEAKQNKNQNETITDYLKNKTNYSGYAGNYKFDEKGDRTGGEWIMTEIK